MVGIISVGLFGQPADMARINAFAGKHGLWVIDDAAQSLGSTRAGKRTGQMADMTATSFFPAKPLGCYGDGGAIFTDDDGLADIARSVRQHGIGKIPYQYERIGMTARMDTLQAAILLEKLKLFPDELAQRQHRADAYTNAFKTTLTPQALRKTQLQAGRNMRYSCLKALRAILCKHASKTRGIPTAIYYPKGIHEHPPYAGYPITQGGLAITEDLCQRILALPFHAWLDTASQDYIIDAVVDAIAIAA